jgi:hypothetical protein
MSSTQLNIATAPLGYFRDFEGAVRKVESWLFAGVGSAIWVGR